jgi:hypothetical protein
MFDLEYDVGSSLVRSRESVRLRGWLNSSDLAESIDSLTLVVADEKPDHATFDR